MASWYVALTDPFYRDRLRGILASHSSSAASHLLDPGVYEAKDPAVGSPFPATRLGAVIRRNTPRAASGYLIAAMGDCGTCTSLSLPKLHSQTRKRGIALLAFAGGDPAHVREHTAHLRRDGLDIPFYHDADGKLSAALNVYYAGRLYYFTPDWRLRWRERDMRIDNYLFTTGRFDRILENTEP